MSKRIVLKVDIAADRCKASAMKTVAKLPGINSMAVDDEKGTLTVVGDVDVVCLASALRKAKFTALVVSVGPEVEEKEPKTPNEPKKTDPPKPAPPCCCSGPGNPCCARTMPPYTGAAIVCYQEQPDGHDCIIL